VFDVKRLQVGWYAYGVPRTPQQKKTQVRRRQHDKTRHKVYSGGKNIREANNMNTGGASILPALRLLCCSSTFYRTPSALLLLPPPRSALLLLTYRGRRRATQPTQKSEPPSLLGQLRQLERHRKASWCWCSTSLTRTPCSTCGASQRASCVSGASAHQVGRGGRTCSQCHSHSPRRGRRRVCSVPPSARQILGSAA